MAQKEMPDSVPLRIIVTGGHSGLGLVALQNLFATVGLTAGCHLILYARDPGACHVIQARQQLLDHVQACQSGQEIRIETRQMDLASLDSVRQAADSLCKELEAKKDAHVDVFLMNAAVAKAHKELVQDQETDTAADTLRDQQGRYETTACVNHVAHLLFLTRLEPIICNSSSTTHKTRIVFTASALQRSLKQPELLDLYFGSENLETSSIIPWNLGNTYAASKFLQMLGVRAYRRKLEEKFKQNPSLRSGVEVVVVQPGFVPQTGLSREKSMVSRLAMSYILPIMPFTTTLQAAGHYIARACCVNLEDQPQFSDIPGKDNEDGWLDRDSAVRSALLEKVKGEQSFGVPDPRTAVILLQQKWWPSVCH